MQKLLIFLLLTLICSCRKDEYTGIDYIDADSKLFLPVKDTMIYLSSDNTEDLFIQTSKNNYFESKTWETDGGFITSSRYYSDIEHITMTYHSLLFNIGYHLYVAKSNGSYTDNMIVNISSNFSEELVELKINFGKNAGEDHPLIVHLNALTINNISYTDVYKVDFDDMTYYLKHESGLIAFMYNNVSWAILE